jgi:putative alpha-1,2-mannosidase
MRVAVSYVSVEGARLALDKELPTFDVEQVAEQTRQAWQRELDRVRIGDVAPGTGPEGLLHLAVPSLPAPERLRRRRRPLPGHRPAGPPGAGTGRTYENFSLWDTIRGENALLATCSRSATSTWCAPWPTRRSRAAHGRGGHCTRRSRTS